VYKNDGFINLLNINPVDYKSVFYKERKKFKTDNIIIGKFE